MKGEDDTDDEASDETQVNKGEEASDETQVNKGEEAKKRAGSHREDDTPPRPQKARCAGLGGSAEPPESAKSTGTMDYDKIASSLCPKLQGALIPNIQRYMDACGYFMQLLKTTLLGMRIDGVKCTHSDIVEILSRVKPPCLVLRKCDTFHEDAPQALKLSYIPDFDNTKDYSIYYDVDVKTDNIIISFRHMFDDGLNTVEMVISNEHPIPHEMHLEINHYREGILEMVRDDRLMRNIEDTPEDTLHKGHVEFRRHYDESKGFYTFTLGLGMEHPKPSKFGL